MLNSLNESRRCVMASGVSLILLLLPLAAQAQSHSLAFASDRTGRFQIWRTLTEDPSNLMQVTFSGSGSQESRSPDWSLAVGRIAYQFGASGVRGIHMITPDGTGVDDIRLTYFAGDERDPSWSPNGQFIVYSRLIGSDYDLWIHKVGDPSTDADDDDYSLLARPGSLDQRGAWSPDGKRIAFVTNGGAVGPDAEIAVVDIQFNPTKKKIEPVLVAQLTTNSFVDFDPTWSPDSKSIAFSSTRNGTRDIFRMSAQFGECIDVATTPEACANFAQLTTSPAEDRNPAWSPDGTRIAFVSERDGNREIYTMSAEDGESDPASLERITNNPASDDDPAWESKTSARIVVDANRDGVISLDTQEDNTTPTAPYRFWLNNDRDAFVSSNDDFEDLDPTAGWVDSNVTGIQTVRDLEDFVRLHIRVPSNFDAIDPDWKVEVFFQTMSGDPKINLYKAVDPGTDYLTSLIVGTSQLFEPELGAVESVPIILDNALFADADKIAYFLFEGVSAGEGALTVRIYKAGVLVAEDKTYLDLRDIKTMHDHWTVGNTTDKGFAAIPSVPEELYSATIEPEIKQYILFVHGWRMVPWERRAFAETAYKRLWHRGYRGGFGLFSWPTEYLADPGFTTIAERFNYDSSEQKAWHSALGLYNLLLLKNIQYPGQVRVLAHSMGNVVTSEALRHAVEFGNTSLVHTYVASQAAIPADAYDASVPHDVQLNPWWPTNYPNPDSYASYPVTGLPYFADIGLAANRLVNFFNPEDYALGEKAWQWNNEYKPDTTKFGKYIWSGVPYNSNPIGFYRIFPSGKEKKKLDFPSDTYEIFAFAARARTLPLGRQPNVGGPFKCPPNPSCELDLDKAFEFGGEPKGHSAQFLSAIQQRYGYWDELLKAMQIVP